MRSEARRAVGRVSEEALGARCGQNPNDPSFANSELGSVKRTLVLSLFVDWSESVQKAREASSKKHKNQEARGWGARERANERAPSCVRRCPSENQPVLVRALFQANGTQKRQALQKASVKARMGEAKLWIIWLVYSVCIRMRQAK